MGSQPIAVADAGPSQLARRALVNWCRRHAKGGDAAVAAGRRLIRPGEPAPLTRTQQAELAEALRAAYPDEVGLAGFLWSRQTLGELILRRYGVRLTARGVNRQLKAWGLGPRTPTERACALCVPSVVSWLSLTYPGIVRQARGARAQVCWAGRSRLSGLSPTAEVLAAVTTRGGLRFAVSGGRPAGSGDLPAGSRRLPAASARLSAAFLSRLARHEGRPVHVIVDGSFGAADWPRRPPADVVLHPMPSCARR